MKPSKFSDEEITYTLRRRIREITASRPRVGYKRIWVVPRQEG